MGLFNGKLFKGINKAFTKAWDVNVQGTKLIGSALFPGAGNYLAAQETNEANRKLQEQANRQNQLLWQQQTQYNDPAAQMTRLQAAGLNPHLAYGQVADSKASNPPEMQAPRNEAPRITSSPMEQLASFQQIMNLQALNKKTQTDNAISREDLRYRKWENDVLMRAGTLKNDTPYYKILLRMFNNPTMNQLRTDYQDYNNKPSTDYTIKPVRKN